MNIRQVEIFRAVMEAGSVTEAARRLAVSQPAVSKHLRRLEDEVGFALFRRAGGRIEPLPEAHALFDQVERVYVGLDGLNRFSDDLRESRRGHLVVGTLPLLSNAWLPGMLRHFLDGRPDVSVSLPVRSSARIAEWVAARQVDVGLAMVPGEFAGIVSEPLMDLELRCVAPPGHPLAAKTVVGPDDFNGQDLITLSNFDRWRLSIEATLERSRVRPRRRVDTFTATTACALVAEGLGICLLDPVTVSEHAGNDLVVRPFRPRISFDISLIRPSHWPGSRLADAFVADLKAYVAATPPMAPSTTSS